MDTTKSLTLYYSRFCHRSMALCEIFNFYGVTYSRREVEFGSSSAVKRCIPASIYEELPILRHGGKIVEDARAILLYISEHFLSVNLNRVSTKERVLFFDAWDVLAEDILPGCYAGLLLDKRGINRYLASLKELGYSPFYRYLRSLNFQRMLERYMEVDLTTPLDDVLAKSLAKAAAFLSEYDGLSDEVARLLYLPLIGATRAIQETTLSTNTAEELNRLIFLRAHRAVAFPARQAE